MSRTELSPLLADSGLVTLSRPAMLGMSAGLVILTGLMMIFMSQIDLDTLLTAQEIAVKVGGTSISLDEFRQLKAMGSAATRRLPNRQFAAELVETLLFAEAGRQLGIDKQDSFREEIQAFDEAVSGASPSAELARAFFLIEELARRTREKVAGTIPELTNDAFHTVPQIPPETVAAMATETAAATAAATESATAAATAPATAAATAPATAADTATPAATAMVAPTAAGSLLPERLHVQTIVVLDGATTDRVLALAASGTPFAALNAGFSRSLYAPVGGDLGVKTALDFPPDVFAKLASAPVGSISIGFTDSEGVHLFAVKAIQPADPRMSERQAARQERLESCRRAEQRFLQTMRTTTYVSVHPSLQAISQP